MSIREPVAPVPRTYVDEYDKQAAEICGDPYWLIDVAYHDPRVLEDRIAAALRELGQKLSEAIQHRDQYEEELSQMRDWKDELLAPK